MCCCLGPLAARTLCATLAVIQFERQHTASHSHIIIMVVVFRGHGTGICNTACMLNDGHTQAMDERVRVRVCHAPSIGAASLRRECVYANCDGSVYKHTVCNCARPAARPNVISSVPMRPNMCIHLLWHKSKKYSPNRTQLFVWLSRLAVRRIQFQASLRRVVSANDAATYYRLN